MTKEKGLTALLSLQASDDAAPELRSKGMDALQANHERPTNPYGRVHPFSTVHPHGLPYESRAEAPGPTCLKSIARRRGSNGKGNCDKLHIAAGRLAVLANYSLNKCLKLFFFPLLLLLVLLRLLQWRRLPHAELPATTDQASTGAQRPVVNASMLTDYRLLTVPCLLVPW
jgi:hypothetical protein